MICNIDAFLQYITALYPFLLTFFVSTPSRALSLLPLGFSLNYADHINVGDSATVAVVNLSTFQYIWNNLRRKYVGAVWELDVAVRNVFKSLQLRGVLDNTIIVFRFFSLRECCFKYTAIIISINSCKNVRSFIIKQPSILASDFHFP